MTTRRSTREEGMALRHTMTRMKPLSFNVWTWLMSKTSDMTFVVLFLFMSVGSVSGIVHHPEGRHIFVGSLATLCLMVSLDYMVDRRLFREKYRVASWRMNALAIGLHVLEGDDPDERHHNVSVTRELVERLGMRNLTRADVVHLGRLASLTTRRNAMLIGTCLHLMLLAEAEELRQRMRMRGYRRTFDPDTYSANQTFMHGLDDRGRSPIDAMTARTMDVQIEAVQS